MSERKSYYSYSSSGSAFGGILTSPSSLTIPTQAMASLSPSGGYGSSSVEHFGVSGVLSVGKAVTTVQGDPKQTELTITLEDVNLMDILKISRLVMHLVSQPDPKGNQTWVSPGGSTIEGLAVHGKSVDVPCAAETFAKYPTYTELEAAYVEGQLKGLIIEPGSLGAPCTARTLDGCETVVGDVKATIYPLEQYSGWLPVVNGGLRVKDFATLYLGEYRITKYSRRLTMLRAELGCDTSGGLAFGDGMGNGHWEPPN
ncbi:MAG TPA: choice-of-anchor P family protein [Bryobacteraceae bacterium]|nr:choice-of-anchor P family protein [Bryobacteraceae bacterium]